MIEVNSDPTRLVQFRALLWVNYSHLSCSAFWFPGVAWCCWCMCLNYPQTGLVFLTVPHVIWMQQVNSLFPLLQHFRILWPVPSLGSFPHTWDLAVTGGLCHHHLWLPSVLGQIYHFLSASMALSLECRSTSFLRKGDQRGEFSENLHVRKLGLCSSNSWFARLAGHQIQGWK